jgi:hypothetical protein
MLWCQTLAHLLSLSQIHRGGVVLEGRLAQFLSESTSPNPRWLVKFDGQPQKDEEMYEKAFGKILVPADDEDDTPDSGSVATSQKRGSKPSGVGSRSGGSNKGSGTSSEEGEIGEDSRKESKATLKKDSQIAEGSNAGSDTSSNAESTSEGKLSRASAREARSNRRQAKIDEDVPALPALGDITAGVKRRPPIPPNNSKKRQRGEADGEVVKVKLLTGTLYLHRGRHRRAEFVRRV